MEETRGTLSPEGSGTEEQRVSRCREGCVQAGRHHAELRPGRCRRGDGREVDKQSGDFPSPDPPRLKAPRRGPLLAGRNVTKRPGQSTLAM